MRKENAETQRGPERYSNSLMDFIFNQTENYTEKDTFVPPIPGYRSNNV